MPNECDELGRPGASLAPAPNWPPAALEAHSCVQLGAGRASRGPKAARRPETCRCESAAPLVGPFVRAAGLACASAGRSAGWERVQVGGASFWRADLGAGRAARGKSRNRVQEDELETGAHTIQINSQASPALPVGAEAWPAFGGRRRLPLAVGEGAMGWHRGGQIYHSHLSPAPRSRRRRPKYARRPARRLFTFAQPGPARPGLAI